MAIPTPKSEHYKNKLAVKSFEEQQKFLFDKVHWLLGPGGLKNFEWHNEKCILRKQDGLCHVWIKRTEKWKVGFDFAETRHIFTTCDGWRFLKRNPTNRLIWPMILTNLRTRRTMRKSNTPWLDCTIKREITNIYSQHFLSWKWYKWPSYIRVVST